MTLITLLEVSNTLVDKIASSGPLAAFQLLCMAVMYAYFKKEVSKKDDIIKLKDQKLEELNEKLVNLAERVLTATIKNTDVIEGLKDLLRDRVKN